MKGYKIIVLAKQVPDTRNVRITSYNVCYTKLLRTPEHAKRLLVALQDNIQKYESVNGPIKNLRGHDPLLPPMSLGGPVPVA